MILVFLFFKNITKVFVNFFYKKEGVKIKNLIIFNLEAIKIFFFKKLFSMAFFIKLSLSNKELYNFFLHYTTIFTNIFSKFNFFLNLNLKKNNLIGKITTKWFYKNIFYKNNTSVFEDFLKKKNEKKFFFKNIGNKIELNFNFKNIINIKNTKNLNFLIIPTAIYFFFKTISYSIYLYNYYYLSIFFFYFLLHKTFFHLSKQYLNGKYTSQIQRFWKRSLSIFWLLETSLFFIFIVLMLISPSEQKYLIINFKEINNYIVFFNNNSTPLYVTTLITLTSLFIFLFFLKKKNNHILINIILIVIMYLYVYILFLEFSKFYYLFNWYSYKDFSEKKLNFTNTLTNEFLLPMPMNNFYIYKANINKFSITINHYMSIIIILKFWHIFFIIIIFLLNLYKYIETNYLSFDSIAVLQQNNTFILIFFISSYIFFFKNNFLYTFSYLYNFCNTNLLFNFKLKYFFEELLNIHLQFILFFN